MLDAWRGLAALTVVVHHVSSQAALPFLAAYNVGHWAVMLFFVISGYCIAVAADSCLRKGLSFRTFMWRRIRRIYPPYLLAVGYYSVTRVAKLVLTGENDLSTSSLQWVQNLTLTQWVTLLVDPIPRAPDNPTNFVAAYWSLGYEEQFYLVIGLAMIAVARTNRPLLVWVAGLMAVAVAWNLALPRLSVGLFIEYWAHFAVGVLVFYRLCRLQEARSRRWVDAVLLALLLGGAWIAWAAPEPWSGPEAKGAELLSVTAFGLLLIALRPASDAVMASGVGRVLAGLGLLTYSLYLVHQCNLFLTAWVASLVVAPGWASLLLQLVLHVLLAVPFYYLCERPFHNKPLTPALALPPHSLPGTTRAVAMPELT
jgi:peptidoglycan/LPS O-acetylase OafA/YrhL